MGPLTIETVPIAALQPDPKNARVHTAAQIRQIARSIETFGFNAPILVDRNNKVVAGHGKLAAIKKLRRDQVSVIRLEHLTPEQARAYAIADNKLTDNSSWDEALLAEHFKALADADLDFGLEVTGFDAAEIDFFLHGDNDAGEDGDDAPIKPGPAVAQLGDLWILGEHRLLCGSALEDENFARLLGDERAAIGFTDAPYNLKVHGHVSSTGRHREFAMASGEMSEPEFIAFLTQACSLMAKWSVDGSLHYKFMDAAHLFELLSAARSAFDRLITICVWHKTNAGMGSLYRSAHELIVISKKGAAPHQNHVQLGRFGRHRTNVWTHAGANVFLKSAEDADLMRQHPTPKPVQLIVEALLDASSRRDIVLEPFCGSGSTLIAAERTGRRCRAIELDPLYVDLTIRRWRRHCGLDAVRESDGASFAELEANGGRDVG